MTLIIQKPTGAKLVLAKNFSFDADAAAYIAAVEAADTQALETNTRYAINDFVIGCKQDGIWSAIKASCILAGARTLAGALIPLIGTAPTNINNAFAQGDYNRKTGLLGNGSTKALDSQRARSADPINSVHYSLYLSSTGNNLLFGAALSSPSDQLAAVSATGGCWARGRVVSIDYRVTGFIGADNNASRLVARSLGVNYQNSGAMYSTFPDSDTYWVFARRSAGTNVSAGGPTSARIAFYSIGESLDLAALDNRVSILIAQFGAVIP